MGSPLSHPTALWAARLAIGSTAMTALIAVPLTSAQAAPTRTPYTFTASAYGTSITGGSVPASSGRSAYTLVSCTNVAGRSSHNEIAGLDLAGLRVGAVTSDSRTYRTTTGHHTSGATSVASVVASSETGARLTVRSLRSTSRAWHDARGYHGTVAFGATLTFRSASSASDVRIPFPAAGSTVALPGLGSVTGGLKSLSEGATYASASGYALKIHLDATNTTAVIGRTSAVIRQGLAVGVMSGRAYGSSAKVVGSTATSGPSALQVLPCNGTQGAVRRNSTAAVAARGLFTAAATESAVRGASASDGSGDAWTRSTVARVGLAGRGIVLRGIRAKAHVHKNARGVVTTDATGTSPGTITVNGTTRALPVRGSLEVRGIARFDTRLVTRTGTSIRVVAVRVTLLSGETAGSVIELGNTAARISAG